jgi:ubiquinone/menaquinone biosynthesis C-methylase UbiE
MVRAAASNASALGLSARLEFREGDITAIPLPDATLDVAVSTLSLHHWSDPGRALAEVHRVLKPGGLFLLLDLRRDARRLFHFLLVFAQTFVVPKALRRAGEPLGSLRASYTRAEVEDLFQRSPFRRCEVDGGVAWFFVWGQKTPSAA